MTSNLRLRAGAVGLLLAALLGSSCGGVTDGQSPGDGVGGGDGHPGGGASSAGTGGTGATVGMTDCGADYDCTVTGWGPSGLASCGPCDPVSAAQLKAVNASWLSAQPRDLVDCEACPDVSETARTLQYFFPRCDGGACTLHDLREDPATNCSSAEDCWLRDGATCCSECDGDGFVAISSTDFLGSCPEQPCPRCAVTVPAGLLASCNFASGRCEVIED